MSHEVRERVTSRFLESSFFARLTEILPATQKAKVERNYLGTLYTITCSITQTVKDEFTAGKIVVGDYVLVTFVDADQSKPLITAKLII